MTPLVRTQLMHLLAFGDNEHQHLALQDLWKEPGTPDQCRAVLNEFSRLYTDTLSGARWQRAVEQLRLLTSPAGAAWFTDVPKAVTVLCKRILTPTANYHLGKVLAKTTEDHYVMAALTVLALHASETSVDWYTTAYVAQDVIHEWTGEKLNLVGTDRVAVVTRHLFGEPWALLYGDSLTSARTIYDAIAVSQPPFVYPGAPQRATPSVMLPTDMSL